MGGTETPLINESGSTFVIFKTMNCFQPVGTIASVSHPLWCLWNLMSCLSGGHRLSPMPISCGISFSKTPYFCHHVDMFANKMNSLAPSTAFTTKKEASNNCFSLPKIKWMEFMGPAYAKWYTIGRKVPINSTEKVQKLFRVSTRKPSVKAAATSPAAKFRGWRRGEKRPPFWWRKVMVYQGIIAIIMKSS